MAVAPLSRSATAELSPPVHGIQCLRSLLFLRLLFAAAAALQAQEPMAQRVIVQPTEAAAAGAVVRAAGGTVTHQLRIIDGVGALANAEVLKALQANPVLKVQLDAEVRTSGKDDDDKDHKDNEIARDSLSLEQSAPAATAVEVASMVAELAEPQAADADQPTGIAPGADLVFVKAFDERGRGSYLNVLAGLDWLLENHERYDIRELNLSFTAPARSHCWDDPINQAVMRPWEAGVTVVASAGNEGPEAMAISVPGNNPQVITVGALTDSYTDDPSDDRMANCSSAGPTRG